VTEPTSAPEPIAYVHGVPTTAADAAIADCLAQARAEGRDVVAALLAAGHLAPEDVLRGVSDEALAAEVGRRLTER